MANRTPSWLLMGVVLTLCACGMADSHASDAPSIYNKTDTAAAAITPAPPPPTLKPADSTWGPVASANTATTAAAVSAPATPQASPASANEAALNQRLESLEKQVAEMRNDMSLMMPALTRLVNAQQDLQQVLNRLETASGTAAKPIADTGADNASEPGLPKVGTEQKPVSAQGPVQPAMATQATAQTAPQPLIVNPQPLATATQAAANTASAAPLAHDQVPPPAMQNAAPQPPANEDDDALNTAKPLPMANAAQISAPAPAPAPNVPLPVAAAIPSQPAAPSAFSVSQIRFGTHANMTRIVLDASGKIPYTYALDGSGTLITLRLPQTAWKTEAQYSPADSAMIESYTATPDGQGGYIVAMHLRKPAIISWTDTLAPSGDGGYRVVMDLTPKS